ncbi:TPR-like protein [Gymnopus androsaceus JB14]|uniref:TPR-like protein n=1 Tax=Gymnopus androsaceus JB14 TaxID=1447944 RepID=A0A6A4GT01_9AGAR|nr:TPR-like protein [Gymnopus androsaceus JB14]
MFAGASNFQIRNSIFATGNVTYHGTPQTTNHGQVISISNVLQCPSPSQYFVGREDILRKLSKIFWAPNVTLWGTNIDVLKDFVRQNLKYSPIFLDASSGQALAKSVADLNNKGPLANALLVLQNADTPVEEYLHTLPYAPVLVMNTESSLTSSTSPAFHLPHDADQQVVFKLSHSIERALNPGQHVVTLVASGGTGKTQTVLKFVSENFSRFSNVWFFDASSNNTLTANFKELGKAAGVGEDVKNVRDFLARIDQNWLCIFDNADDEKVFLKDYIPNCNHGNVFITSRLSETAQMASPNCQVDLKDLTKGSAVKLLLNQAHKQGSYESQNLAFKIVNALGCHALAVSTAGAYIGATPTCTLENYLTHFNKKKKKILNYKMRSLDNYQRTVYSAFLLSFEKLSYPTQLLLQICGYLNPTAIPLEILIRAAAFADNDTSASDVDPPIKAINFMKEFLSLFEDEDSWEDSIVEMCQLSLVSYNAVKKCLDFHAVIHTCVQETVEHQDYISQTAALLLARATPLEEKNEEYQFRRQLLIHASHVWQANNLPAVRTKVCLAKVFEDSGFLVQAEKLGEEVLLLCKTVIGDHHPDTLTSMANLAITYCRIGKLEAAEKLGEEVLLLHKKVNGEHHPHTLTSMANLAHTYGALRKLEAAKKLGEEVLLLQKQVLGEHHPHTLTSMGNLALTYWEHGKLEAAEMLGEEVLLLRKQVIGDHHPNTLTSMGNLASTYREHGKLEAAEKLEEEVLSLRKQVSGDHHPDTLTSMGNLALTYSRLGKLKAAEKLEEEVLTLRKQKCGKLEAAEKLEEEVLLLRKQVIGDHHPDTLASMANLAYTYQAHGKLELAEKLGEEVLMLRKQMIGDHHPNTLTSMSNLASTYRECGKLKAARKLEKEVLSLRKQVSGDHHPDTLTSMGNLALTYSHLGNLEAAEKLEEEVLSLRKHVSGDHHPHTLTAMGNLAATYQKCGKLEAAEKLEEEVLLLHKQVIGNHHPDTLTSMANLASMYQAHGKLVIAEKLGKEVLLLRKQVIGDHHPNTLTSMSNLASIFREYGKLEAAEKLEQEVLSLRKQVTGDHHPDTLTSMGNLALTYSCLGKLEAAEKLEEEVLSLCKQISGDYHPHTLTAMGNLAATYQKCGKLEAAEKLEEEVLLLRMQVIGDHHPDTLTSMANLAVTYSCLGKLEATEKLEEEVLLLRKQVIGDHHPDTLTSMANLAVTYCLLGKLEAAEKLEKEVLLLS